MTNEELRDELRARELIASGSKKEMVQRLTMWSELEQRQLRQQMEGRALRDPQNTITLPVPSRREIAKVEAAGGEILDEARALRITTDEEYEAAGKFLVEVVKPGLARVDEVFDPNIRRWHEGHKAALEEKRGHAAPLLEAERIVKGGITGWRQEVARRQELERRKAEREARERAEVAAREEALRLLGEGRHEEAEEMLEELAEGVVPTLPVPVRKVEAPRVAGISTRTLKRWRLVDVGKMKREYMVPDEKAIQAAVTAMGKRAEAVVGEGSIEYYEEESVGARR